MRAAADPRGASFGTTLTREQLEALSDDPEVLRQQVQEIAGTWSGDQDRQFRGGCAAAESSEPIDPNLTRSIRGRAVLVTCRAPQCRRYPDRDHHAARTRPDPHEPGIQDASRRIDRPEPVHPGSRPEQFRTVFLGGGGTLNKNKSSCNIFFNGTDSFETPNINVAVRVRAGA